MKIACVQQAHNPGGVSENRTKALYFAEDALNRGVELILFHEEMLVGYDPGFRLLAEPVDGETTQSFRRLLQGSGSKIIYGLTESSGDNLYISATVVAQDGVVANYRKTHLWRDTIGVRNEPESFTAGDELVAFEHGGYQFGLLICYDGDFPEMFRAYAKMGCAGVLWMNNRESRGHSDRCQNAAVDNSLIVATSCCCGTDETGQSLRGLSNIVDCDGVLLAELDRDEGIIIADVDPARALAMRPQNPWFTGLRPELY